MSKDYEVGYGKPPVATQFKPGQSGNPKGRPRGQRNLATDLEEELSEKIQVTENGRSVTVTKQRAMIKTLVAKALKGDTRAAGTLIQLARGVEEARADRAEAIPLDEEDREILEAFLGRHQNSKEKSQ